MAENQKSKLLEGLDYHVKSHYRVNNLVRWIFEKGHWLSMAQVPCISHYNTVPEWRRTVQEQNIC
jgi:hypothetical protein